MSEKPETEPEVQPRLEKLDQMWDEVLELCKNKGKKISAAHKGEEFKTDVQNMTTWVQECETSVITTEKATDIITATKLYQKHKVSIFLDIRGTCIGIISLSHEGQNLPFWGT